MTTDPLRRLQTVMEHEIPITRHLQFRIHSFDEAGLMIKAPLEPNINHKGTVFGGSLNMLATLAGWGMVHLVLEEAGLEAQVVVQKTGMDFLSPLQDDFEVICRLPEPKDVRRFLNMLRRWNKGRIHLQGVIMCRAQTAAKFTGMYVALADQPAYIRNT